MSVSDADRKLGERFIAFMKGCNPPPGFLDLRIVEAGVECLSVENGAIWTDTVPWEMIRLRPGEGRS